MKAHKSSKTPSKTGQIKRQQKYPKVSWGYARIGDVIRDGKVSDPGLAMDVYAGGKRLPPGKSVFDFKPRKKK